MAFKFNIGTKEGKTYHFELETEEIIGKSLHDKISGKDLLPGLDGYELEIAGAVDKAGFASRNDIEGIGLKKILLTYGEGLHKKPKGDKK